MYVATWKMHNQVNNENTMMHNFQMYQSYEA